MYRRHWGTSNVSVQPVRIREPFLCVCYRPSDESLYLREPILISCRLTREWRSSMLSPYPMFSACLFGWSSLNALFYCYNTCHLPKVPQDSWHTVLASMDITVVRNNRVWQCWAVLVHNRLTNGNLNILLWLLERYDICGNYCVYYYSMLEFTSRSIISLISSFGLCPISV